MTAISADFVGRLIRMHGASGKAWVENLPSLIDHYARRWSLQVDPPIEDLTYNYIAPAIGPDGDPLVLKLGMPNPELLTEIEALALFAGRGAVRLIASDPTGGALLLERVLPGTVLYDMEDDLAASRIACQVMVRLWRPCPPLHRFPTIAVWGRGFARLRAQFGGETGPFPSDLVDLAERIFYTRLETMQEQVVLHGDLHHWNILASTRDGWLAIDPKGVIGERAYEVGAWMRNPFPGLVRHPAVGEVLQARLDYFAETLMLDRSHLKDWAFAQAILSAWWNFEDRESNWEQALRVATLLLTLET